MIRSLSLIIAALFAIQAPAAKVTNEQLTIGTSQEYDSLNPIIATMMMSNYIYSLVGRSLVVLDAEGKWIPQLAQSIPSLKNGGAKIITLNGEKTIEANWVIRSDAKWSDGTPVVCADFQLALEVINNPNVSVSNKEELGIVEKVEWQEKTPQNCKFTYNKLRWDFYQIPRLMPLPSKIEGAIYKKFVNEKQGYEKNSAYSANPTTEGLYNGPYKVSEIKLGSYIVLVPNSHFYGPAPKIKKIIIKLIPNTGTLEAHLLTGTIDMIAPVGYTIDLALALEKKIKAQNLPYVVTNKASLNYEHIDLQQKNPILKDKRVRKALLYSINREELNKSLFEGRAEVALHPFTKIDPWYVEDPKKISIYKYDLRQATQLLDEAGWVLDKSKGYRYKNGEKLSLQFMTTAGNKIRELIQTYLQTKWRDVGIEIIVKNEPPRVLFGEAVRKSLFSGMVLFAWSSFPERPPLSLHSKSIPSEANGWSGRNTFSWSNARVDELIEKIDLEFDGKKRASYAQEIARIYSDELPALPMFYLTENAVYPQNLKNFRLTGHQFYETNEVEKWELSP